MSALRVSIVRTGVANTASVRAAFARLGCDTELIDTPRDIDRSAFLVLPGVGSFAAGMEALRSHSLVERMRTRIQGDRPTLAICLGMQLLGTSSEESPGVEGLGVLDVDVLRLDAPGLRVPQFGWNRVVAPQDAVSLASGHAYYANSYCLRHRPAGWQAATTVHGTEFVAAIERGSVVACQFHPELSGAYGAQLLERWLASGWEIE